MIMFVPLEVSFVCVYNIYIYIIIYIQYIFVGPLYSQCKFGVIKVTPLGYRKCLGISQYLGIHFRNFTKDRTKH